MNTFEKKTECFRIVAEDPFSRGRAGVLTTPHGEIETPVFMPVGTQATVKSMDSGEVEALGYRVLLANTYHLFLRPGLDLLKKAGGLHKFMAWPHAILTDSGGYQVFSLATRRVLREDGVEFSSHVDGKRHLLTPEVTTGFQLDIGSDISMCLDDCPPYPSLKEEVDVSMRRTLQWTKRVKIYYDDWVAKNASAFKKESPPLLFGIVQGGGFPEFRRESSTRTAEMHFPGFAVGGLGLGEPRSLSLEWLEASLEPLPKVSPHYLMGFGKPEDMWEGVERGVDMFDCVLPTRNGRNGQAFTFQGRLNLFNKQFRDDFSPLDLECSCATCRRYTRAYLCHLFRAGEMLAPRLVTLHNLCFMIRLLAIIRKSLVDGNFQTAKQAFFQKYQCENQYVET